MCLDHKKNMYEYVVFLKFGEPSDHGYVGRFVWWFWGLLKIWKEPPNLRTHNRGLTKQVSLYNDRFRQNEEKPLYRVFPWEVPISEKRILKKHVLHLFFLFQWHEHRGMSHLYVGMVFLKQCHTKRARFWRHPQHDGTLKTFGCKSSWHMTVVSCVWGLIEWLSGS